MYKKISIAYVLCLPFSQATGNLIDLSDEPHEILNSI